MSTAGLMNHPLPIIRQRLVFFPLHGGKIEIARLDRAEIGRVDHAVNGKEGRKAFLFFLTGRHLWRNVPRGTCPRQALADELQQWLDTAGLPQIRVSI